MASGENFVNRRVDIDPIWQRFINPSLHASLAGHFAALVKLAENYQPDYLTVTGVFGQGFVKAEFPSSALAKVEKDAGVLSVELREFIGK